MKFTWLDKFSDILEPMPDDQLAIIIRAIMAYGRDGTMPNLEYPLGSFFASIKDDIDFSIKARERGSRGGRAKPKAKASLDDQQSGTASGSSNNQGCFKQNVSGIESAYATSEGCLQHSASGNESAYANSEANTVHSIAIHKQNSTEVEGPKRKRFSPPTPDEVKAYCKEKGYDRVDPDRFVDFYASKGWVVGKSPMKNWKAAVSNWHRRELDESTPKQEVCTDYDD